ncbi:hypothetical protein ABBQ38_000194 [Trebouxia sp. C0009 RCD-2024]
MARPYFCPSMQAQTTQAQSPPPLPALKPIIDELAERMAQHLKVAQQSISMRLKDRLAGLTSPYDVVQSVYKILALANNAGKANQVTHLMRCSRTESSRNDRQVAS